MECVECGTQAGGRAEGWRAYRADLSDPHGEGDAEPDVVFYCPNCARREFGSPTQEGGGPG